jgi:ABC-type transport system involved in cytochrome c biogenesis permease component
MFTLSSHQKNIILVPLMDHPVCFPLLRFGVLVSRQAFAAQYVNVPFL